VERFLSTREVAHLTGFSVNTLKQWRSQGGGPKFMPINRTIRYPWDSLLTWMNSWGLVQSTAEVPKFPRDPRPDRKVYVVRRRTRTGGVRVFVVDGMEPKAPGASGNGSPSGWNKPRHPNPVPGAKA
jgi:predicted DNA-binding transcriptional regulator AlpA